MTAVALDPDKQLDDEVKNFAAANPDPPVDPAFPDNDPFGKPTPPALPLPIDPALQVGAATPPDSLPSGLTGEPPADALPPAAEPLASNTGAPTGRFAGLLDQGNIDLANRPVHRNPDGSISTVRSSSFNIDGKEVLIPTIAPDGTPLTDDQAVALYRKTGQHLGKFDTPDHATAYAQALHEAQASKYLPGSGSAPAAGAVNDPGLTAADNRRESAKLDLDQKKAQAEADAREAAAKAAEDAAAEARQQHIQYQADRQAAQDRLDQKTAAYEAGNKLVDPSKNVSVKSRLAVLFSGLGSAIAGGPYKNEQLEDLHKSWDADTERQKANIAELKDSVVMARTGLKDVDEGRRQLQESADAKNLATYNAALKQGQSQLANLGMDQAAIDSDSRIQGLKLARQAAADRAAKDADAHLLNQARIRALDAQATKAAKKAKGGGGGSSDALAKFSEQAGQLEPGDPIPASLAVLGRQAGLKPNQIAAEVDRYRGSGSKSAKGAAAGGVGTVRQNAVLGNLAEAEKAAKDIVPGGVSMDAINKLQTNEEQAKAAEHSASGGVVGNLLTRAGRATGAVARGRYEGIPEDQQKKITAAEQVITHLTEMQQGKNIETLEQYRDRYSPYVPGLSEAEVRRRETALPGLVAEQRAIQDPNGVGTKRVKAAEAASGGGEAATGAPAGKFSGMLSPGNIDLAKRPVHKNADGSISTVRSSSFNIDGKEVLIPTIAPDGTPLTDDQAVALYRKTGQHLGKFDTPEHATAYAKALHNAQAKKYLPGGGAVPPSQKYTLAKQALAPGSGATAVQRANAQAYLDSVNGK